MEELRSTEILDKEIQEDARKKAERILRDADVEAKKILAEVTARIAAVKKEKETLYEQKAASFFKDADAALPLEKKRFLVSFEGEKISSAINEYLVGLSEAKREQLLASLLKKYGGIMAGRQINVMVFGMEVPAAERLLQKTLGDVPVSSAVPVPFEKSGETGIKGIDIHQGFILETTDRQIRCRVTLDELAAGILDKFREQLAAALFCGRLPQ